MKDKRSFFERLTGTVNPQDVDAEEGAPARHLSVKGQPARKAAPLLEDAAPEEGELTVDVYQSPDDIIVKTIVAGVRPEDLDISITRDMITIRGSRQEANEISDGDSFHKELYWGSFSRTILLPQEIDVDASEASEKHGLLTLRLPKIDKQRIQKLKIKSL